MCIKFAISDDQLRVTIKAETPAALQSIIQRILPCLMAEGAPVTKACWAPLPQDVIKPMTRTVTAERHPQQKSTRHRSGKWAELPDMIELLLGVSEGGCTTAKLGELLYENGYTTLPYGTLSGTLSRLFKEGRIKALRKVRLGKTRDSYVWGIV